MANRCSGIALWICCGMICIAGIFYYPKWKQPATEATISWDVSGYYFYLPAVFIYKDMRGLGFADSIISRYKPTPVMQQAFRHSSGHFVMKYTMGQAVLYSPSFFVAHIYALCGNGPADGFSFPYQLCLGLGMLLYACAGLLFLRKALLHFFDDRVVAVTLIIIVFATNYLNYAAIDGAMAHNTSFMLYSILLYATIRFHQKPVMLLAILIGGITGLLTLVRPTECISVLLPLLWGMKDAPGLRMWLDRIQKDASCYLAVLIVFCMVVSVQCMYWKWATGEWLVYTYREEGFDWLHPQVIKGLFSYRAGWFVYTPVMLFVIPGFVGLYLKQRGLFPVIAVFFIVFLYICFSWKVWWYGAGVGQRAMIQAYPVLSFPLCAFIAAIFRAGILRHVFSAVTAIAVYYNVWLTHQAHRGGLLKGGEMNKPYLYAILGKYRVPAETASLLDNEEQVIEDTSKPFAVIPLSVIPVELNAEREWAPEYYFFPPGMTKRVRAEFNITTPRKEWEVWKMPQVIIRFYKGNTIIKVNYVRVNRSFSEGETGMIAVDALPPQGYDKASVFAWNAGSNKPFLLHGIQIKLY